MLHAPVRNRCAVAALDKFSTNVEVFEGSTELATWLGTEQCHQLTASNMVCRTVVELLEKGAR
jgi:hypothetical protein